MPFARLLKAVIGLDVASVGPTTVEWAVKERLRALGLKTRDEYWDTLRSSAAELQLLVETVAVSETWFFRDPHAFTALGELLTRPTWRPRHTPVRLLSLPCSTGEEPYSMVMALLDAGVPRGRFHVDAVDVSRRALSHAGRGVYGQGAFRGTDLAFRDRYFDRTADGYVIADQIRQAVAFHQGNLVSADLLPGAKPYDVIFCRNLLIYFDREMRSQAVAVLSRLLAPDGVLFVGASECGALLEDGFVAASRPGAFALRKADVSPSPTFNAATQAPIPPLLPPLTARSGTRLRPALSAAALPGEPPGVRESPVTREAQIARARYLADHGHFAEATICCNEELSRGGPSAEIFYLLGLVRDASGNHTEAAGCYRKALYLEPDHVDAMMQLALLVEGQDNHAEAERLRKRIKRLTDDGRQ